MRFHNSIDIFSLFLFCLSFASAIPAAPPQQRLLVTEGSVTVLGSHNVSLGLFAELEELARIVDISYCVGVTGIRAPFECASRCGEFKGYQLVDTWNTGPLLSDSCGYIALDHNGGRILVAFRGTYSIANTIVDLSTIPQEYVPYPGDPDEDPENNSDDESHHSYLDFVPKPWRWLRKAKHRLSAGRESRQVQHSDDSKGRPEGPKCNNCTVHMGFFSSWKNARPLVLSHLRHLHDLYPDYDLHLVGHSLGGAVAALAALETEILGWHPTVTTFGEPRVGNIGLRAYLDEMFELDGNERPIGKPRNSGRYRRITHTNDPVPLLPLTEWGYRMHAGEIYISKSDLSPAVADLWHCDGDEDVNCIFGGEADASLTGFSEYDNREPEGDHDTKILNRRWGLPARYRMWQLFFAHRDYFWRLGLCVPGGDPTNLGRRYDNITDVREKGQEL